MLLYAQVLPSVYQALTVLMEGQDEDVVITAELYGKAMAVIDHHSDSGDLLLEEVLQEVSNDLTECYGLTRTEFISNFSQE